MTFAGTSANGQDAPKADTCTCHTAAALAYRGAPCRHGTQMD